MGWEPALKGKQILKKLQRDFSKAYVLLLQSIYFATDFDCPLSVSFLKAHSSHLLNSTWLRHLRQQESNLVGTPWDENKMVTAGCDQGHQKPLPNCAENGTRTPCGRKCNFLMGADCNSFIPHEISLQTTESLGLEKDLFVRNTDVKKNKVLYNDCKVSVQSLCIVLSVLWILPLYCLHCLSMIN